MRNMEDVIRDRIVTKVLERQPYIYRGDKESTEMLGHMCYAVMRAAVSGEANGVDGTAEGEQIIQHFYSDHKFEAGEAREIRQTLSAVLQDSRKELWGLSWYFRMLNELPESPERESEASIIALNKLAFEYDPN